jgi:hypothetical protein
MNTNYAHKAGLLQGFVSSLWYHYKIPGIEINDTKAFRKFLEEELSRIEAQAIEYNQMTNYT